MAHRFQSLLLLIATASKNELRLVLPVRNAFRDSNTNANIERFVQSTGQECLDRFVIFGEADMNRLCQEYLGYYHHERPHQSLENAPLVRPKRRGRPKAKTKIEGNATVRLKAIRCKQRLGWASE